MILVGKVRKPVLSVLGVLMSGKADIAIDYLEVDGVILRVGIKPGSRSTPLLLFNGIGANLELGLPFILALEETETIIFDIPGTGRSSRTLWPKRFSGLARLSVRLLDRLGYGAVDVAGVSWGGALAQQFAWQYPNRCRRLILAATSPGAVMVPGRLDVLSKLMTPARYLSQPKMRNMAPDIYGGEVRQSPHLVRKHAARVIAPSLWGYLSQIVTGVGWTSIHWLHRLKQPTLILAGDDDPLVPTANATLMSMLIPNSRVHIVRGGGHLFMVHLLDDFIPTVKEFLHAQDAGLEAAGS